MKDYLFELKDRLMDLVATGELLAIKAEFEAEGTRIDELVVLSQFCCEYSIPLTLKIGGPSARRDMYEAFQMGASNILVPMVESRFALETCASTYEKLTGVFYGLKDIPNFSINIETKVAVHNLESILKSINENKLPVSSLVVGRTDLSTSLGIADVNAKEIYDISRNILSHDLLGDIDVTIGGNLGLSSFEFLKDLSDFNLYAYESRKCTFRISSKLTKKKFSDIINRGLQFELAWLNYKRLLYKNRSNEENMRIDVIKSRLDLD